MIKFLIYRPIAVMMSFFALLIFSAIALSELPISLLPDTDVPQLSIKVTYENASPQQIDQTILKPIRESMATLNGLKSLSSQASNELGDISLTFTLGTSMDLVYISANEKMDRIMNQLPPNLNRPSIIKANTSDIPVIKIQAIPQANADMAEISNVIKGSVKKRIEQVNGVSIVDINGTSAKSIAVSPDKRKLMALGLKSSDLIKAIQESNESLGTISVKDGQYRYIIKVDNVLKDINSIKAIGIKVSDTKSIVLGDVARIYQEESKLFGTHLFNQSRAIALNIHKQKSARMISLVPKIKEVVDQLNKDYKEIKFKTSQDQSTLLNVSIDNLNSSLAIGGVCALIVLFLFMSNIRIPLIMGISLPASIMISFLIFWVIDLSINIITLSGLALGLGMLIDNAIIVTDNIARSLKSGLSLSQSCVVGVQEVVSPLISSVMTTLAVFIPLIFLGGIAGELFYDQAISVSVILIVSLFVAFILLPVLFRLILRKQTIQKKSILFEFILLKYKSLFKWVNSNSLLLYALAIFITCSGFFLYKLLKVEGLPAMQETKKVLTINWIEPITLEENIDRINDFLSAFSDDFVVSESDIGASQFILQNSKSDTRSANLYFELKSQGVKDKIENYLYSKYPRAKVNISVAPNAFDQLFNNQEPYFEARFRGGNLGAITSEVKNKLNSYKIEDTGFQEQSIIKLNIDYRKLKIYNIPYQSLVGRINELFGVNELTKIKSFNEVTSVYLSQPKEEFIEILNNQYVSNSQGDIYTLSEFISPRYETERAVIHADLAGTYSQFTFNEAINIQNASLDLVEIAKNNDAIVSLTGQYFENQNNQNRLLLVLTISVLLLYFILVAQFESFIQPLIIILTLPIGISGSVILLYIAGMSINIMSLIGIIITLGIIVNDSILKLDTINRYLNDNLSLSYALAKAGSVRLKPILMTSITTILALVPILFLSGLGSTLQAPLVYAVIGGLTFGTLASLFLIPLLYKLLINKPKV